MHPNICWTLQQHADLNDAQRCPRRVPQTCRAAIREHSMNLLDLATHNLLSPMALSFALGFFARRIRSDLSFPEALTKGLSIFLLLSIGLKGGAALAQSELGSVSWAALATLAIGCLVPLWTYPLARRALGLSSVDGAAVAAHYGSTSAVTFLAALAWLASTGQQAEGFMPGLLALMEVPGIAIALLLAKPEDGARPPLSAAISDVLRGKSILLLLGGLAIGMATGPSGMKEVEAFFVDPFKGVLCLFLLDLGLMAADRISDLRGRVLASLLFATLLPAIHGTLGALLGVAVGLSPAGATLMAILSASASYIAAPAAVRMALPTANPGLPVAMALGITFPFNLLVGIPLYHAIASAVS
jgi:hypothetical protein